MCAAPSQAGSVGAQVSQTDTSTAARDGPRVAGNGRNVPSTPATSGAQSLRDMYEASGCLHNIYDIHFKVDFPCHMGWTHNKMTIYHIK